MTSFQGAIEQGSFRCNNRQLPTTNTPQRQLLMGGDEVRDSATPRPHWLPHTLFLSALHITHGFPVTLELC
ncbi:hypothetical protein [Chroococcidiopsis sp. CCNUC1]|uniref:hypothetical protein n=1 Tax=Chroococcidiopsis sp. CCNUC1 TaxID=2653189 RepID=UPI0020211784|nr:hypothetical protein [Chroococcidiopsis sp. CCNUC1]URD48817.1 hypothetical protein M5J74_21090 [Chroococcidiopsis sp. CCNUC1]